MGGTELRYTGSEWVLESGTSILEIVGARSRDYDLVVDSIEGLSSLDQRIINMFYYERMTYQEISDELRMKGRQYAHYRLKRALRRLRAQLEMRGYEVGQ